MKYTKNQLLALFFGIILAIGGWYQLILLTQRKINVKKNHYIGLCFAILIYILWWLKFVHVVDTN